MTGTTSEEAAVDTAVLVIDMQNGFVHPDGSVPRAGLGLPNMDKVIAENAAMIAEARAAGLPVIYTRHVWRADMLDAPADLIAMLRPQDEPLLRGTWDADVCDELAPLPGDVIIDKNRFDAFLYTDLEVVLRAMGVRHLLVSGVVTSICVESTVRSAQQRDFQVTVAADCTSAPEDQHDAALAVMAYVFATVGPWRDGLAACTTARTAA
jgi:ureidoacrylate peracid hydrolase